MARSVAGRRRRLQAQSEAASRAPVTSPSPTASPGRRRSRRRRFDGPRSTGRRRGGRPCTTMRPSAWPVPHRTDTRRAGASRRLSAARAASRETERRRRSVAWGVTSVAAAVSAAASARKPTTSVRHKRARRLTPARERVRWFCVMRTMNSLTRTSAATEARKRRACSLARTAARRTT
jgi:hypothetical protein